MLSVLCAPWLHTQRALPTPLSCGWKMELFGAWHFEHLASSVCILAINKLRVHGLRRFNLFMHRALFIAVGLEPNWRWKCICPSHRSSIIIMPNPRHWSYPRWVLPPHDDRNRKEPMYWDLLWWEGLNLELSCMQRSPCYQFYLLQCYDAEVDAGVRRDRDSFRLRRWG